jgi:hypothetical protein
MSEVVVLAKNYMPIPSGDSVAENITVSAPFQDRNRDPEVGHLASGRVITEHFRHIGTAETKQPPIQCHRQGTDRREHRSAQRRTESALLIKRENCSVAVGGVK